MKSGLVDSFYVTGGTLRRDATCYVVRQADSELHAALRRGEFCYVLTARQRGKSSLMVRTAARPPTPRKKTRPPKASKRRRLDDKKKHGALKTLRARPKGD